MSDLDLMLRFMLQVLVVLLACRALAWVGTRFLGQTPVVMEMVAGVALGPSLFGLLAPGMQEALFPQKLPDGGRHPSMTILYVVAQIGLVLYMFLVGVEFDARTMGKRAAGAVSISLAGIVAPFLLGAGIVLTFLHHDGRFFGPSVGLVPAALFLGAAMCITAFPMLARIIVERGLSGTSMGTLALGAGATDDAVAWSLLAVVLAVTKGNAGYAFFAIGGGALYAGFVLTAGKRLLARFVERVPSETAFAWTILIVFTGAYITDAIGVYAVFGAFLLGVAMPRGEFAATLRTKIESLTIGLFLPFFFVYSGLNTRLSAVAGWDMWAIALLLLVAAMVGKGVACGLAARAAGETWRDASAIGVLMNARGLMELIILNIGLQQGVITPALYATLVLMAIVTTLVASPLFGLTQRKKAEPLVADFA